RRITESLLWLFVLSLAWDRLSLPGFGRITILLGVAVMGAGIATTAINLRFRSPGLVLWLGLAFVFSALLSVFWSISSGSTVERVRTYLQLVGIVWLVWEFARTRAKQHSLLMAFCLGMFVPLVNQLNNFRTGVRIYGTEARFSGGNLNANEFGLYCALLIPIAWYLMMNRRGAVRVVASIAFLLAPIGAMLTGNRGSFLAGIAALTIIPLT